MPYARRARVQDELVKIVVVRELNLEYLSKLRRRSAKGKTKPVSLWLLGKIDACYLTKQRVVLDGVSEAAIQDRISGGGAGAVVAGRHNSPNPRARASPDASAASASIRKSPSVGVRTATNDSLNRSTHYPQRRRGLHRYRQAGHRWRSGRHEYTDMTKDSLRAAFAAYA